MIIECAYCEGTGRIKSLETIALELKDQLSKKLADFPHAKLKIRLSEELFEFIKDKIFSNFNFLHRRRIFLKPSPNFERGEFEISDI